MEKVNLKFHNHIVV